ncbi:DUF3370 domain-containing protein [Altericista sp. CCNU0014]|uniref:DUF3370 domain-containing protein n=1 Tax=Altericista sp. CCNU0014 TaxID=3082949 RepID=UPI00384D7F28
MPGRLDDVPMFNSNSPEWVKVPGILLSTFPPQGKTVPTAHLNYAFNGPFTLFTHHFSLNPKDLRTLYLGILVRNPGRSPVTLSIPAVASYLLNPDAPFANKPQMLENPTGAIHSGPGIRAVDTVLRGQRQPDFPAAVSIPAGGDRLLLNHPIPVKGLDRNLNGRSTFIRLSSSGPVYVADLAMYAPKTQEGKERSPTLAEWQTLLKTSGLAGPRDKTPTPPGRPGNLIYGRVAGVQKGSAWKATLADPGQAVLKLPSPGQTIAYPISTLRSGRFGTGQSQAAPLLVRYPDTAYEAHGNYCVHYDLALPLRNGTDTPQTVALTLTTPVKADRLAPQGLRFLASPTFPFFRGTVRLRYSSAEGRSITRYFHLWHRTGEQVKPLLTLNLNPKSTQTVKLDFLYPPDSTPPQVLKISTLSR